MESEVDTSILNAVNIKRFTESVLEEYGAEIDRSNRAKWEVNFPEELSEILDRQNGTLVFEAADRELGAGDLLVQPGTTVFSALLDLIQRSDSIGCLRLTEDNLQVNPPEVLQESGLDVVTTGFRENSSDFALVFHFHVQFETPSSFHSEEMFSATIDPENQARLPDITERLTSHLPQLLEQNQQQPSRDVSETRVQESFEEAQQAVVDRSRNKVSEIREEADESAGERIDEVSEWYEQRREELNKQIEEKREEIKKWRKKYRRARKDSTQREYIRNKNQAEKELEELREEVEKKRRELNAEEDEEIDEVIERNSVDVDVSLIGVTEVTYVSGTLSTEIASENTSAEVEISYLPATDQFQGLDCTVCSQDLTKGVLPRICLNGHLIGDPCSISCRNCGLTYCEECEKDEIFETCVVCWESVCEDCVEVCSSCGSSVCADHRNMCAECGTTCHLCGEDCSTDGTFHCDEHLSRCPDCTDLHCSEHTLECEACGSIRCEADMLQCSECDDHICPDHIISCSNCGRPFCEDHTEACSVCSDRQGRDTKYLCQEHRLRCSVGGKIICSYHSVSEKLGPGYVCRSHQESCEVCGVVYSEHALTDGQCTACRSLGDVPAKNVPPKIKSEFRSVKAGSNEAYMIVLGKKLLGRNKLIVYDINSEEEIKRDSAGMLKQLTGGYR